MNKIKTRPYIHFLFLLLFTPQAISSERLSLHPALQQLVGHWKLTEAKDQNPIPQIEIKTRKTEDNNGIIVNLYEKNDHNQWAVALTEYITYEKKQSKFYVLWNNKGTIGKGVGQYSIDNNSLTFSDSTMDDKPTLSVVFKFINKNKYLLTGSNPQGKEIWSFVYEKI
ncbi:hypothetical protein [Marinibactrum halimedae]|uniref:DUF1579 domain-containing protein n=1 Tax=Marinibactrum halimedae TaxID=1444977 RepID=A0AA37TAF2_9GAMM|nr:hypothetical protein [Marinibactrum halimedae]MCD9460595.1 hypothetical protein [Marinibactrum halimedae]GLS27812.1 hypothetical protein GCM10007877_35310 [Marinibactrum halimedae]